MELTDVKLFYNTPYLERLSLRGNKIHHIVAYIFNKSQALVSIDLSYNQLTEINQETFAGLYGLKNL